MYSYISAIHAAAITFLVSAIILFLRRKEGERSRLILSFFILISVVNYLIRELTIRDGQMPMSVVTVPMLLLGVTMTILLLIYPAEIISPGWISLKRVVIGCLPVAGLYLIYQITLWLGVEYTPYFSLIEMMPHVGEFNVQFRLFLCLFFFFPPFLLYCVPFTRKYNNTDSEWIRNYIIIVAMKNVAYIIVLVFDNILVHCFYYYVSIATMLYLVYIELFVRIIPHPASAPLAKFTATVSPTSTAEEPTLNFSKELFEKAEQYMAETEDWRDPELTLECLAKSLNTNRTTLWQAFADKGYSYNYYIAKIRIEACIRTIHNNPSYRYMDAFYEVGFRSRSTALRSFKMITGVTPSEYFK